MRVTTSKSPRRVLHVAYDSACQALPAHRHKCSPKKFTQPQLLACLVLKEFLRLDYRGLAEHLTDHTDLAGLIGLKVTPHFTTFHKAATRLLRAAPSRKMFDAGLDGGKIPSAPADTHVRPAVVKLMIVTPIGNRVATRRRTGRCKVFSPRIPFPWVTISRGHFDMAAGVGARSAEIPV